MSVHVHRWVYSVRDAMRWCDCGVIESTYDEDAEDWWATQELFGGDPDCTCAAHRKPE